MSRVPSSPKTPQKQTASSPFLSALFYTLWVVIIIIIVQFLIGRLLLWSIGSSSLKTPVWIAIFSALSYLTSLFIIIFIPHKLARLAPTNREQLGLLGLPTWTDIGLAPIGFVVSILLSLTLTALFSLFPWFNPAETQSLGFSRFITGPDRLLAFATLAVLAPIAEEIIFRGWLYAKLRARLSAPIAILITSFAFGLVHLQWNIGVNVFAVSIILCLLREITGTIYSGIFLHITKNALAFYLLFVLGMA